MNLPNLGKELIELGLEALEQGHEARLLAHRLLGDAPRLTYAVEVKLHGLVASAQSCVESFRRRAASDTQLLSKLFEFIGAAKEGGLAESPLGALSGRRSGHLSASQRGARLLRTQPQPAPQIAHGDHPDDLPGIEHGQVANVVAAISASASSTDADAAIVRRSGVMTSRTVVLLTLRSASLTRVLDAIIPATWSTGYRSIQ